MKLKIVVASQGHRNIAVNALVGERNTKSAVLRAQLDETQPRGTRYRWRCAPFDCVERAGKTYVPDYLTAWVLRGHGTLYVEAVDRNDNIIAVSQVVIVRPTDPSNDGA